MHTLISLRHEYIVHFIERDLRSKRLARIRLASDSLALFFIRRKEVQKITVIGYLEMLWAAYASGNLRPFTEGILVDDSNLIIDTSNQ